MDVDESAVTVLPYVAMTEHLQPLRRWRLEGNGIMFTELAKQALRTKALWIVMQDSNGSTAMHRGDIVSLARVEMVDWLSMDSIVIVLDIDSWGIITSPPSKASPRLLAASKRAVWTSLTDNLTDNERELPAKLSLREDLYCYRDALLPSSVLSSEWHTALSTIQHDTVRKDLTEQDVSWLCLRWLELLPLPITMKQRLIAHHDHTVCRRYLKKMIRCSDRYTE